MARNTLGIKRPLLAESGYLKAISGIFDYTVCYRPKADNAYVPKMLEKTLTQYEGWANRLNKIEGVLVGAAFIGFFLCLILLDSKYSNIGIWVGLVSIWFGGLATFSYIYSPKHPTLIEGKNVNASLVRNSSTWLGISALIFTPIWTFVAILITIVLVVKSIGVN